MTGLTEESDVEAAEATTPWYARGWIKKLTLTVSGGALLAVIGWAGSTLISTAGLEAQVDEQGGEIEQVETVQETLEERLVPAVERIDERTEHMQDSIDDLQQDVDRVEARQFERVQ